MTSEQTTTDLRQAGFPLPEPEPEPGCQECARLDRDRDIARANRDRSAVSDCNVRMRVHHQPPPTLHRP